MTFRPSTCFRAPTTSPTVKALGKLVYTNNPWGCAARGAGPPQANFALESAMDMLAEKIGIDPLEFRLMNSFKPGQRKIRGPGRGPMAVPGTHARPFARITIGRKREVADYNRKGGPIRRGVGLGTHSFGISMSGDSANAAVELEPDGGLAVFAAAADPGEGNDSMFTQIAAHLMDLPMSKIRLVTRSTERTTATGPAAGSRMTYMVGGAMVDAIAEA